MTWDWPSREEFEAERRKHAEHLIEHGVGYENENDVTFTEAERTEIQRLAPHIIREVRRECGRVERALRKKYPEVVWLLDPGAERYLSGEYDTAVKSLTSAAAEALDTLREMRILRRHLRWQVADGSCSLDTGPFTSVDIERLHAIRDQAQTRHRDMLRHRGHDLLSDIESGLAWRQQQEHQEKVEKWRREGPVVR